MGFIVAKCPNCGANIRIDKDKDAGICPHCGTAFVTEKVINQSFVSNTTNIEKQTNIYYSESKFEKEKSQCEVLLMLLQSEDFVYLKERALKVLDINPTNSFAQMLYRSNFNVVRKSDFDFVQMDEEPIIQYLNKEMGNIDNDTCISLMKILLHQINKENRADEITELLVNNLVKKYTGKKLEAILNEIIVLITESKQLDNILKKMASDTRGRHVGGLLINDLSEKAIGVSYKKIGELLVYTREKISIALKKSIESIASIEKNQKAMLIEKIDAYIKTTIKRLKKQTAKIKVVGSILIIIGIILMVTIAVVIALGS